MARENSVFTLTGLEANANLSTKQFYTVKMASTNNRVALCDTQGEPFIGILQNKPSAAGDAAEVMGIGISKVRAAETLTAGDMWGTDANGKAVKIEPTSTGADLSDFAMGFVIEGAGADGLATVTVGMTTMQVVAS